MWEVALSSETVSHGTVFPDGEDYSNQKGSKRPVMFFSTLCFPGGNTRTRRTELTSTESTTVLPTVSPSKLDDTKSKHDSYHH